MERAPFDITAGKHHGAEASVEANLRTSKEQDRLRVAAFVRERGRTWLKQVVRELNIPIQTASGRLSELKALNVIETIPGEREEGCSVVRMAQAQGQLFN